MNEEVKIKHLLLQKIVEMQDTYVSRLSPLLNLSIEVCFSYCEEIHYEGYIDFIDVSTNDGKDAIVKINGKGEIFSQSGGYKKAYEAFNKEEQNQHRMRNISNISKLVIILTSISTVVLGILVYFQNNRISGLEEQLSSNKLINSTPIPQKESKLVLKAIFKGGYSNFNNENDSNYYYLVDVKLINKTKSNYEFWTLSCASLVNILTNSKQVNFLYHNCSGNSATIIRLKPNQEYSIPVVLLRNKNIKEFEREIKFGFVFNQPKYRLGLNIPKLIIDKDPIRETEEMRDKQENVIWSDPIELSTVSFNPFEIRNIINDTTYTIAKYH